MNAVGGFSMAGSGGWVGAEDLDVLGFALERLKRSEPVCIATLIGIDGTAPRPLGAQMAIDADGRFAGHISSGCLEREIATIAQLALVEGRDRIVRYGRGSPYIDIKLPCGSGIDVLYSVGLDADSVAQVLAAPLRRELSQLRLALPPDHAPGLDSFCRVYTPPLRLVVGGRGREPQVMSTIARSAGYQVLVVSPDETTRGACGAMGAEAAASDLAGWHLVRAADRWSAVVSLFHEQELDDCFLDAALASDAFYVGAVGSRRTQQARRVRLSAMGIEDDALARLHGPIGLVAGNRDAASLAISTLAEVLSTARG